MNTCNAKLKTGERCSQKKIQGLLFCKRHCKSTNPILWHVRYTKDITRIQKTWRGFVVRKWLKLAGKGVLNRKLCTNTEDLLTFNEIQTIHPLHFFSFEENHKVFGFNLETMINIFNDQIPKNPYTRTPISFNDRKRFRKLMSLQKAKEYHIDPWVQVSQIMEENGFSITSELLLAIQDDPGLMHKFMSSLSHKFTDLIQFGTNIKLHKTFKHALWLRMLVAHEKTNTEQKFGNILLAILNDSSDVTADYYSFLITTILLDCDLQGAVYI